jgi:hypothetical protein
MPNQKFILIYTLLIGGLGGYIYHLHCQKAIWLGFAEEVLKAHEETRDNLDRINLHLFRQVDKTAMAFRTQHSSKVLQRAETTRRLCAEFLAFTDRIRTKHWAVGSSNKVFAFEGLLATQAEQEALTQQINLLCDSFCVFAQGNKSLLKKIKSQFFIVNDLFHGHREDQKLLYLASLDIQALATAHDLLHFFGTQMNYHTYRLDSFLPNLTLKQPCVKAGEPFDGFVSLEGYSADADNVAYYCNDKRLRMEHGLGKMRLKIGPGDQKYAIKAVVKNPLTGEVRTYMKEFPINLCKE